MVNSCPFTLLWRLGDSPEACKCLIDKEITNTRNTRVFVGKKLFVRNNGRIFKPVVILFHRWIYPLETRQFVTKGMRAYHTRHTLNRNRLCRTANAVARERKRKKEEDYIVCPLLDSISVSARMIPKWKACVDIVISYVQVKNEQRIVLKRWHYGETKKRSLSPALFNSNYHSIQLRKRNCLVRTNICACATFCTHIRIDRIDITFWDSAYRTLVNTCTASNAVFTNYVSHNKYY